MRYGKRIATAGVLALLTGLTLGGPAGASSPAPGSPAAEPPDAVVSQAADDSGTPTQGDAAKVLTPDKDLPSGWQKSADRAVTVSGDGAGLHVLAADSSKAYQWRTVATLSEPAFTSDLWIGNVCVTGSGKRAVVVYAPREFTNTPQLMEHGGFAAVVDLTTGKVVKLADQVTLAYFNPGCGTGETAVLTQIGDDKDDQTRLLVLDTTTGKVTRDVTEPGQITSAVPRADGSVVGAMPGRLVGIDTHNRTSEVARTSGPAFQLRPDSGGGVNYLDLSGNTARAHRTAGGATTTYAQGPAGKLGLHAGIGGRVFLTGAPASTTALPAAVKQVKVPADAVVSSTGALAVDQAVSADLATHTSHPLAPTAWGTGSSVRIQTEVPATGKKIPFTADPSLPATQAGETGGTLSPALGTPTPATKSAKSAVAATGTGSATAKTVTPMTAGSPTSPVDDDRTCAPPRNDAMQQAYQPTPNQVEWAADMAIRGDLMSGWVRQGGWRTAAGLGTVSPQAMFPLPGLTGNGGRIPAQVLLGVLAQESNLWQAEGGALPGQTSSTLASTNGFYGHPNTPATPEDHWKIDWTKADCGYGIGQQTDGMNVGSTVFTAAQQKAIALDYTSNIAVAAQTLESKWNELHSASLPAPIKINDDNPAAPENWFAALWNYNSGFNSYSPGNPSAAWGLGYLNNPTNPLYPPDRLPFLDNTHYADAAHPQQWTYEEKVLGWGAAPIDTGRSYADSGASNSGNTAGYSAAWWNSSADRTLMKPPKGAFCDSSNACDPSSPPRCEVDHLGPTCDPPHWYKQSYTWKNGCDSTCGHEYLTYQTLKTELGNGNNGAGTMCDNVDLGFTVIDDVSSSVPTYTDGCGKSGWYNSGTFGFSFNSDSDSHYEAKGDLHQIGGGFGDHFWYAHTRDDAHGASGYVGNPTTDPGPISGPMAVTGTWKLSVKRTSWTRVLVHLPNTGSASQQAVYTIHRGDGTTQNRVVNAVTNSNKWVDLGIYHFTDGTDFQGVTLSNYTPEGQADNDISWDAVGFQWLGAKPRHIVAALGDSYSSGEGAGSYDPSTDQDHNTPDWNACRRSANAWPRKLVLPGESDSLATLSDNYSSNDDLGFVACSGAHTWQVDGNSDTDYWQDGTLGDGDGQFREIAQVDSGVLTKDTTLVTMTIGGNNYGAFVDAITECASITDCSGSGFLSKYEALIDKTKTDITGTLQTIAARAPNAKIVLVGYPEVLSRTVKCTGSWYFDGDEAADLATLANYMDAAQKSAVDTLHAQWVTNHSTGANVGYVNPVAAFVGHGGCDSTEWINKVVLGPNGDGDFHSGDSNSVCISFPGIGQTCLSREAFHPNNAGTTGYQHVVESALPGLGYTGGT